MQTFAKPSQQSARFCNQSATQGPAVSVLSAESAQSAAVGTHSALGFYVATNSSAICNHHLQIMILGGVKPCLHTPQN